MQLEEKERDKKCWGEGEDEEEFIPIRTKCKCYAIINNNYINTTNKHTHKHIHKCVKTLGGGGITS